MNPRHDESGVDVSRDGGVNGLDRISLFNFPISPISNPY